MTNAKALTNDQLYSEGNELIWACRRHGSLSPKDASRLEIIEAEFSRRHAAASEQRGAE